MSNKKKSECCCSMKKRNRIKLYEFAIVVAAETEWQAKRLLSDRINDNPGNIIDKRNPPKHGTVDDWAHVYEGKNYDEEVV